MNTLTMLILLQENDEIIKVIIYLFIRTVILCIANMALNTALLFSYEADALARLTLGCL